MCELARHSRTLNRGRIDPEGQRSGGEHNLTARALGHHSAARIGHLSRGVRFHTNRTNLH
jgi:hypothetical protein